MGVPKQRHTKSRRNRRRMHLFIKAPFLAKCLKCGKPVLPHTACLNCGYYQGREIIDVLKKLDRKERKKREKEMKSKDDAGEKEKSLTWEGMSKK
jgi:large subunit ribosomal protein L32